MALKKEERERRKALLEQGLKYCPSCKEIKPTSEFNKSRAEPDGFNKTCRTCSKARWKERTKDGPRAKKRRWREELRAQGLKDCTRCKAVKPLGAFGKKASRPDGLNGWCKQCEAEYHAQYHSDPKNKKAVAERKRSWRLRNPEKVLAQSRRWAAANKEEKRAAKQAWHAEHREEENAKARERMQQWIQDNPERYRANQANRSARERGAEGSFTEDEWLTLLKLCGNKCLDCGTTEEDLTKDHIVPVVDGGSNYISNIQPLCKSCNSRKGAHHQEDMRPERAKVWALSRLANEKEA